MAVLENASVKVTKIGSLVISSGQTLSSRLSSDVYGRFDAISIAAPAAIAGVTTVKGLRDEALDEAVVGSYNDIESPAGTVLAVAVSATVHLTRMAFPRLAVFTTVAPGADETYVVYGHKKSVEGTG